jgi:hypothetical protein
VAGPGSQILLAQTAFLLARGRASVLAPTYSEHARILLSFQLQRQ